MELYNLSKKELLLECDKLGITNEIIKLINSTNTNNISPLRYPDGKTRACKIINNILLEHFDTIVSPFFLRRFV
jgi:hypothetical protein